MKIHGTYILNRLLLLGALFGVLLVIPVVTGVSVVNAKSASDVLQARTDRYAANLSVSDTCKGPTVYLTGTTTVRYRNNSVADGTIFDRTDWYSDAVGNGYNTAFTKGRTVEELSRKEKGDGRVVESWQDQTGRRSSAEGVR